MRLPPPSRAPVATLLATAGLVLAGCSTTVDPGAAAEGAVRRFFAALPTGDCGQLEALLVTASRSTCEETVRELHAHAVQLREVLSTQVDGRTPNAVLVRARVAYGTRVKIQVLRVERHAGAWRLRL